MAVVIRERRPVSLGEKGLAELYEFATHGRGKGYAGVDAKAANLRRSDPIYLPINDLKRAGVTMSIGDFY